VNSAQHHQEDQKDLHGLSVCLMDDLCIDLNQKIAVAGGLGANARSLSRMAQIATPFWAV
jgi:hypothetical protein